MLALIGWLAFNVATIIDKPLALEVNCRGGVHASASLASAYYAGGLQHVEVSVNSTSFYTAPMTLEEVVAYVRLANGTTIRMDVAAYPGGAVAADGPVTASASLYNQSQLIMRACTVEWMGGAVGQLVGVPGAQSFDVAIAAPASSPVASVTIGLVYLSATGKVVAVNATAISVPH